MTDSKQSKGGKARAATMTKERLSEIASMGGRGRALSRLPKATHMGEIVLAGVKVPCANLSDGRRVISITAFVKALDRARPGGQTYKRRETDGRDQLPIFLASKRLGPHIPTDFSVATICYAPAAGGPAAEGIDAMAVPLICDIWVKAWAAGSLLERQVDTAAKAATINASLATVGIAALVDEATGYQYSRDRDALAVILETYLGKELAAWTKTFPDDFYRQLSKLRNIQHDDSQRPMYFGHLTNEIVYSRLAPGVKKELRARNPRLVSGSRKHRHHQLLSRDVGHPELRAQLAVATALMKISPTYEKFIEQLDHVSPRFGDTIPLLSYEEMQPPGSPA